MIKSKKGFTLTELCVVMAITAIVATMVVTTSVFIFKQNADINQDTSFISEVTDVQTRMNEWLKRYDNAGYQIVHKNGQGMLEAKKGEETSTITFSEKCIKIDGVKVSDEYKNISGITFQIIEDKSSTGAIEGKVAEIKIMAKNGTGKEPQTLLFPLFSNKTRERNVTGKNG